MSVSSKCDLHWKFIDSDGYPREKECSYLDLFGATRKPQRVVIVNEQLRQDERRIIGEKKCNRINRTSCDRSLEYLGVAFLGDNWLSG